MPKARFWCGEKLLGDEKVDTANSRFQDGYLPVNGNIEKVKNGV